MAHQDDLRRIALSLPEVTEGPDPMTFRVAGKLFAWPWMERVEPKRPRVARHDVIGVRVANEAEKHALIALDGSVFFTEPHYDGWPAVLVRLEPIPPDLLEKVLTDAWRLKAPAKLRRVLEA